MERRILLVYCGWELTNLFLGGVLSGSAIRWAGFRHACLARTTSGDSHFHTSGL
jgi:hypothetical protein